MSNDLRQRRTSRLTMTDYLVFLIPFLEFVQVNIVGVLNGTDICLICAFLYFAARGRIRIKSPIVKRVLILGLFWLASQILTDLVRHSAFADYARGWSNISLTLINFVTLYVLLYGRPRRFVIYGWGLVPSIAISYLLHNFNSDEAEDPWKFGYAYPVTLAVVLLASHRKCRENWRIALIAAMGLINILLGARSLGGICLVAALYLVIAHSMRFRAETGAKLKSSLKVVLAISLALGGFGIFKVYQFAASSGKLGEDARGKYEEQSSGKYGLLLGGRSELFSVVPAIMDSPILGHGSWAKDPTYLIAGREAMLLLGYKGALDLSTDQLEEGLIPTHSFLLGAWVYAGVLGAVFWGWVWFLIVKALARIYPAAAGLLPLMAYVGFLLLWDILFSPFGLDRRNQVPYFLLLIFTYYEMSLRSAVQAKADSIRRVLKPALSHGE